MLIVAEEQLQELEDTDSLVTEAQKRLKKQNKMGNELEEALDMKDCCWRCDWLEPKNNILTVILNTIQRYVILYTASATK